MEEIKVIKTKIDSCENNVKLYVLADVHIGSPECDIESFKKVIKFIESTPNTYVILLGDILDTALRNSKTDIYSEVTSVADAQKLAVELLMPIKDKIIAMTPGNHENRVWKEVGIDLSLWLAEKLGLEDKYRTGALAISLSFGKDSSKHPYRLNIFGQHGAYGGGRKLGAAMNALEDLDGVVSNADVYIRAHTHSSIQGNRKVFNFNDRGSLDTKVKCYFNAPSFLRHGGYGLEKGYKPQDNSPCYLNIRAYEERVGTKLNKYFKIDKIAL